MTGWEHCCSLNWLKARQNYLTASDIKHLIPFTASGRPRVVGDDAYLRVLAHKRVRLQESDCMSYGMAARGHLLEPYAIKALNEWLESEKITERYHHWDDALITNEMLGLAFSPDGMTIPLTDCWNGEVDVLALGPSFHDGGIAEVKSYNDEKFLTTAYSIPKEKLEERWQIATAMATDSEIDHAYLVLFNPRMQPNTYIIYWEREELEDEMDVILDISDRWYNFKNHGIMTTAPVRHVNYRITEEQILAESIMSGLNPA